MAIFDMGAETLGNLSKQTDASHQDLGALVRRFVDAVTPLEGKFSGAGKAAFDSFKNRSDLVASELNTALAGIVQGQSGMNTAFTQGDLTASDNARRGPKLRGRFFSAMPRSLAG
ncbi:MULTISPECIES: hypothetical protein [Micrococcaceae]|jgi:uncharacterized protein YukE|uniref:WXG100 family type VII secretion target n=1 Tax=Paenarthrobacter aurescens (strain TC1) TaxID=290340 RepID=A1R8Y6_PAEAT|nr:MULTISPECIES: hypothetical protein [Micrococcaceae]ABM09693.1 conserved hypothetical protein [Paenarthrobacter aurescens TC1]AFR30022.1 hypothetical protein ARUE_c31380 [Arthrobacter sp. Rue61a]MBP2264903.1 uncharacterized protein YukE [Pseudarthrobacter sp. PvP004]